MAISVFWIDDRNYISRTNFFVNKKFYVGQIIFITPELVSRFDALPTMIASWKRSMINGASDVFDKGHKSKKPQGAQIDDLYLQIGQLKVETNCLSGCIGNRDRSASCCSSRRLYGHGGRRASGSTPGSCAGGWERRNHRNDSRVFAPYSPLECWIVN